MRKLLVTSGPAAGHELEIDRELVVGRDDQADVTIPDGEISRRHAVLRPVEQGVEIEDLDSLNGTYVDGQRISGPVTIPIRGAVKMGTSELVIEVELPQVTLATPVEGAPLAHAAPPLAATVVREAAAVRAGAAAPEPQAAPEEQSRVESPHLPIPASIAIFAAAIVAIVLVLVLT